MAGFSNDTVYGTNVDFSGNATVTPQMTQDGQLLIGSSGAPPNITAAFLTAGAGITITNGPGAAITIAATGGVTPVGGLTPDAFTPPGTSPVVGDGSGNIVVTGAQVATGVIGANVIRTDSLAANTLTIEIQRSTAVAASDTTKNGVSHFDNTIFTVGAGGFVSLVGGAVPPSQKFDVDANTAPGTDPVVPTAGGVVTVTGGQVAAGTVGANVIRTDSLAANTYTIEIQRATTAAASTLASNGVSHYDNTIFTVGAGGFVSLVGGAVPPTQKFNVDTSTPPGTDPVVADAGGIVTVTGGQVGTGTVGTNVIRINSAAANTMAVEIQRSTAVAGSDITKNGVAHFNSANFTVDANGFVSAVGGGGAGAWTFIETQTSAGGASLIFNTSISSFTELMFVFSGVGTFSSSKGFFFKVSADNGSTFVSGTRASMGTQYALGVLPADAELYYACNQSSDPAALTPSSGYVVIQNTPGSLSRISTGDSIGSVGLRVLNLIGPSGVINYVRFSAEFTFNATISAYGR